MSIELPAPRRPSADIETIEEEPEGVLIELAEKIQFLRDRCHLLCDDQSECIENLRFGLRLLKNREDINLSDATKCRFWKSHESIADSFSNQFSELEKQRMELEKETLDCEKQLSVYDETKFCITLRQNRIDLMFHNFWNEENRPIYTSLNNYSLRKTSCCVIM